MSSEPWPPGSRPNGAHVPSAPAPAAPAAPPAPPPMPTHLTNPELDVAKLQSLPIEQQDLFMLQFATDLSRHVESLSPDDCTSQQFYLKKQIFQIINLPAPQPSTPVRNDLARCLAHIFSRGDRKLLFETINDLVAIVSSSHPKSRSEADKTRTRHAAVCCLGAVFAAAGDSAVGLHQLACATLLRLLRSSASHAGLRAAVFAALAKIVQMVRSSMDDTILRDIWKQARAHAATDKAHLVVVASCRCLVSLLSHTGCFGNVADFESLKGTMFKLVDSASVRVRHASAECLAVAMTAGPAAPSGGRPDPAAAAPRLKKPKSKRSSTQPAAASAAAQDSPDDREAPSRSQSPAPAAAAVSAAAAAVVVVAGGKKSTELVLSFADMLRILSTQYVKPSTTNRGRAALAVCYGKLLRRLGEAVLEANYLVMVENLTVDLLAQPTIANNRYRLLTSRRIVDTILQDVANKRILAEAGQAAAARSLIGSVLKNYPHALPDRPEPSKHMLIASLGALASLIRALGSAANSFADACRDGLLQALQHPSYSVQVSTASCVKTLVLACPQQLLPCLSVCMNGLARELSHLGTAGRNSARRCVGFAHALAAALSASPARPLHGSLEVNSRVLTMATSLLKSSGQSDLRVSTTQIQVAWILIGGLMSLGPNFVKIHLSQLLLLWKNALPKPLAKDNTATRTYLEASFLAHVRECALGSILAFVQFNSRLLTVDVSKRIAAMLQNTSLFLRTLPARKTTDDITQRLTPALQLYDLDMMVQRRVLQCYVKLVNLSPAGGSEALLQSNLLTLALPAFCDPENSYSPASVGTSIANAAQTFETIWEVADNSGFGLTGLVTGFAVRSLPGQQQRQHVGGHHSDLSGPEDKIDRLLLSPVCGSLEHDASLLYVGPEDPAAPPDPAPTEVVNMAIQLFAFVFPLTPAKVQESVLEQIKTYSSAGSLQRDPGRRAAMTVNLATAVLSTLRVAVRETRSAPGHVTSPPVEALLQDMIRDFAINADPFVRSLGYSALALLCSICGAAFTNHEIKHLVDTIVVNREPSARAGCAMALGAIQTKVGGMSAGYHLKTILAILMSLCTDPHPTVHYWALEALSLASDAAGLGFSAHVPGTLAMLAQLYASDTHNPEVGSAISSNLELDFCTTTTAAITRCVDSLVNVLGPDLQESTRSRHLILTMIRQLQRDDDGAVQRAALVCLEHLSLYAPGFVNFADYVRMLQKYLCSESPTLRDIAVDGLHNMMKRDPQQVLDAAERGLEEQLWLVLDADPAHDGVRNIIRNWLRQTCLAETAAWLQRFQRVFKMTRPRQKRKDRSLLLLRGARPRTAMPDLQDEEVAGFAVAAAGDAKDEDDHDRGAESAVAESAAAAVGAVGAATAGSGSGSASAAASSDPDAEPLRWQVTTFAAECLYDLFTLVGKDAAANGESRAQTALQNKVGDVVRLAFSASTSGVPELRVWGLKIIGAVLKMFGRTADPDFEEAMLLEQYQAQIGSALTPAFAADSSPELAAEAVRVCAGFVATGIVTDVDRMGRILKTLVGALESFSRDGENAGIGDLAGLSANAQVMVKMAIFAAWAELQVASSEQVYLLDVLRPHIGTLTPLWLDSLREFARLRFEPDISMTLGPPSLSGSLDTVYAALNRETLLRFYQDSWLRLVDAIASLIGQDSEFVFDALDGGGGKESDEGRRPDPAATAKKSATEPGHASSSPGINYRDEPVAFFFVLFGLAFEALATRQGHGADDPLTSQEQTLAILRALKKILHPSVSGLAIYRDAIFSETMDLLDRLVLTDGLDTQGVVVDIARALCIGHPSAHRRQQIGAVGGASASAAEAEPEAEAEAEADLSDDIEQLFELTRIIVLVLSGLLPNLTTGEGSGGGDRPAAPQYPHHNPHHHMNEEAILLIRNALDALVDAAEVFPSVIRTDLHACIIHIFSTILATPACQEIVVPQALPTLKRFVSSMTATAGRRLRSRGEEDTPATVQLRGCLRRFLSIYLEGQKRETSLSLTCVKNCLLASTLLFTGAGRSNNRLPATDSLVARYLDEVLDCLTDRMTAKIAANCIRSLLIQQRSDEPTPADLTIARYLLPRLIAFVTNTEPEDPERARALVAHTLTRYAAVVVPRDRAAVAVSTILPALMARAASEGGDEVYRETSARLLEMAAADQVAFRATVAAMSEGQRAFLEEVIRSGRQDGGGGEGDADADGAPSDRPTIELKMDFGG